MTFCKEAFSHNPNNAILLKGAIIDRYLLRKEMSQGEIVFIDENKLAKIKKNYLSFNDQEELYYKALQVSMKKQD